MFADAGSNSSQEFLASDVFRHVADVATDELHGIAAVGTPQTMAQLALGCAAIDDGNEISGDDDAVLAFHLGVLGNESLFYDLHDEDKVR